MMEKSLNWDQAGQNTQTNDLIELVGMRHKSYIFRLKSGEELHTHRGIIQHDDLIGIPWGTKVYSHKGSPFFILQPTLENLLKNLPRNTQILYPKDIGFIITKLGIGPGKVIVEAGTGSGALTAAMAFFVGRSGRVISYEKREQMQSLARKNLTRLDLLAQVELKLKDIGEGFDEKDIDALFLDLPNPQDFIYQVKSTLKPGGTFGCILPTVNQVTKLLTDLRLHNFAFIEVCEILLRYYKPEPERFRPVDRMVAHTGFLVFARPVLSSHDLEIEKRDFE